MEVFITTAQSGSFAAASAQLGLSAQMVARHIQALEERLNIRLINRTTRKQSLTEAGVLYYERCKEALAAADAADALVLEAHAEPQGRIRISAPHQYGAFSLMRFVSGFMERYPGIEVDLNLSDRAVNVIEEGYEAAFRIGETGIGESSSLVARPLRCYQMITCASPSYLERNGVPLHPLDLESHNCIGYVYWDRVINDQWLFTKDNEDFHVRVGGRLKVNDPTGQLNAARCGMGILLAAKDLVSDSIRSGELVQVLDDYRGPSKPVHLIYPADKQRSAKLRKFIEDAVVALE
ncbi:LysR substrate-binding domain-containing protein [Pseudomonas sp. NPDC089401]|uniref:LysR substrate-binding domain-containing protein n=1 Tax=Pseudomonas sp. NPDC089401 TaxID=3364462 RepID=UPI00380459A1